MSISVGDKLPEATFTTMTAEGPTQMTTADVFDGRKVVLFAVPGAFTPIVEDETQQNSIDRRRDLFIVRSESSGSERGL